MLINLGTSEAPFWIATAHITHIQSMIDARDNERKYHVYLTSQRIIELSQGQYNDLMTYWDVTKMPF